MAFSLDNKTLRLYNIMCPEKSVIRVWRLFFNWIIIKCNFCERHWRHSLHVYFGVSFSLLLYREYRITFAPSKPLRRKKLIEIKFYLEQHVHFIITKNPKWFNLYASCVKKSAHTKYNSVRGEKSIKNTTIFDNMVGSKHQQIWRLQVVLFGMWAHSAETRSKKRTYRP